MFLHTQITLPKKNKKTEKRIKHLDDNNRDKNGKK